MHAFNPLLLLAGASILSGAVGMPTADTADTSKCSCSTTGITFVPVDVGVSRIVENAPNAHDLDPVFSNFSIAGFVEPALRFSVAAITNLCKGRADAQALLPNITKLFIAEAEPVAGAGPLKDGSKPVAIAPFPAITTVFSAVSGARTLVPSMSKAIEPYLSAAVALASGVPNADKVVPLVSDLLLNKDKDELIVLPTATFGSSFPTKLPELATCTTKKGAPGHC